MIETVIETVIEIVLAAIDSDVSPAARRMTSDGEGGF